MSSSPTTAFTKALSSIDAAHAQDPNKITVEGGAGTATQPYELHYAQKCTAYLSKRVPDSPSEALQLAVRAQHLRRWEVPRASFPMTRPGYHAWRTHLKKRQAEQAAALCVAAGYDAEFAERVASLIRKEDLKRDEESQVLEDVACLVFLDDQFEAFEKEHDEQKIVGILRKTWGKMSAEGHRLALGIPMSERCLELVKKALEG